MPRDDVFDTYRKSHPHVGVDHRGLAFVGTYQQIKPAGKRDCSRRCVTRVTLRAFRARRASESIDWR
jgi:hypothetical protein